MRIILILTRLITAIHLALSLATRWIKRFTRVFHSLANLLQVAETLAYRHHSFGRIVKYLDYTIASHDLWGAKTCAAQLLSLHFLLLYILIINY